MFLCVWVFVSTLPFVVVVVDVDVFMYLIGQ